MTKSKSTFLEKLEKSGIQSSAETYKKILELADAIRNAGGCALLVGGFVRDMKFGLLTTDFDIEVYKLAPSKIEEIVKQVGKVHDVGKSFGVLKIFLGEEAEIDVSLPRRDSKIGAGHKGFHINTDPNMSITEAASRRDFTINSITFDPLTEEIFDPFNGLDDLKNRILRVTNPQKFGEDPLRVLRGLQFVARFELQIEWESKKIMQSMVSQLHELAKERIFEEWKKLLLKAKRPSFGLIAGMELGLFAEHYPDFLSLAETPQDPEWHPEGDVWVHTVKCMDAGATIIRRENLDEKIALVIMLAVLCHDLGKPLVTTKKENRIVSPKHQKVGEEPTRKFIDSIGVDILTKNKVIKLVENHLAPFDLHKSEFKKGEKVTDGAIRRLAKRLHPATIYELTLVAEADFWGKGTVKEEGYVFKSGKWLLERANSLQVKAGKPDDIIKGKDLIALGFSPGRKFGKIIEFANHLRDEKGFTKDQIIDIIKIEGWKDWE